MSKNTARVRAAEKLLAESMKAAAALHKRKSGDYGHFTEYPAEVFAAMIFVKSRRILQLSKNQRANFEPLADSCVDMINYAGFLYAKIKLGEPI